eukprot:Rmarinus@m.27490
MCVLSCGICGSEGHGYYLMLLCLTVVSFGIFPRIHYFPFKTVSPHFRHVQDVGSFYHILTTFSFISPRAFFRIFSHFFAHLFSNVAGFTSIGGSSLFFCDPEFRNFAGISRNFTGIS